MTYAKLVETNCRWFDFEGCTFSQACNPTLQPSLQPRLQPACSPGRNRMQPMSMCVT